MIINEKLAFQFGWKPEEAIGKQIRNSDTSVCTVVGVMKDFTPNTLFDPIQPVAMVLTSPDKYARIIVRAKPGSLNTVFAGIKTSWAKLYPMKPFRGYYQDEVASEAASVNESIATIFRWFAIISVLMAATSMFALVSLNVLKRSKEIAIRKVVGAEDKHIFQLVLKRLFMDHFIICHHRLLWRLCAFQTFDGSDFPDQCGRQFIFTGDFLRRRSDNMRRAPSAREYGWFCGQRRRMR